VIDPLVLLGKLVTFDESSTVIDDGALYIGPDEKIAAVQKRSDPAPVGFDGARRVETKGVIYPGLMDLHNHCVYNVLSLWAPPGRSTPYVSRDQWPRDRSYEGRVSDPANALGALAGKAHLKYVEVKAVVGGVTAMQGSAKMAHPYEGWLVRNVEYETFMTGKKSVYQSVLPFRDEQDYKNAREKMTQNNTFLYHLAEGTDPKLIREYSHIRDSECLLPRFGAIHCTALNRENFDEWAPKGGSIIWSPFSNMWLYGATTDVLAARAAGLRVCLGADWSPSGSKNLLGEMKVADLVNRTEFGGELSAQDICRMATSDPADALGWDDRLGRLLPGLFADVVVTTDRIALDPYRNLIEAVERDIELVAINGQPFYGTNRMMRAAGETRDEPIQVGGLRRRIVLVYPDVKDADMGWADVLADLRRATADPVARYLEIEQLHAVGKPPAWLMTDKPWDDPERTGKEVPVTVHIPRLDSLVHDKTYFNAVDANPLHGGKLGSLRDYYFPQ
jgi:cytosine/adenosine deaminase-related metal-dependent hydrolase